MPKLYEINEEMRAIVDLIILAGGEITPELEAAQEACNMSWFAKLEAYNKAMHNKQFIIDTAEGVAQGFDREADRVRAMNKTRENGLKTLKDRVKEELESKGEKKIDFATGGFTVRKGSVVVDIVDACALDKKYLKEESKIKILLSDIKIDLKKGVEMEAAVLKTNPTTLTVR